MYSLQNLSVQGDLLDQNIIKQFVYLFDISEKEVHVFLSLYGTTSLTANLVAKRLNLNRTTTISILERLRKRGMVKKHPHPEAALYSAASNEELQNIFIQQKQVIDTKKNTFDDLIVDIEKLRSYDFEYSLPKISYYEGVEQCQNILMRMLDMIPQDGELLGFVNVASRQDTKMRNFWQEYYQKRMSNNILMRQISPSTDVCKEHAKKDRLELRKTKLISFDDFPFEKNFEIDILPHGFATILLSQDHYYVTLYEDIRAANAYRNIFELIWNSVG